MTNVIEKIASSWSELNTFLFAETYDDSIRRHRSTFAYRGVNRASYNLENSLMRLGEPYDLMEENLLKQFRKYAFPHLVSRESDWHHLSIAQHHGLPTRLLDWTYSPPVALHFALTDVEDFDATGHDGAVWRVDFADCHRLLPAGLTNCLQQYGSSIFSVEELADTIEDLAKLNSYDTPDTSYAIFFEPPAIDERIINQFAYFSMLTDPFLSFDEWLGSASVAGRIKAEKIIIPKEMKWEYRDKLDQSNTNERVLMTGLDGLCAWLKRHYTPRHR